MYTLLPLRQLTENPLRTMLSLLAIALGVAMMIASDLLSSALLNVLADSEIAQSFGQGLFDQLKIMLQLVGVAITVAAGFLVYNAFGMSVTQRRQQIGALRSLGMTRSQVIRLVLLEGLITALIGIIIGLILGPLLGRGIILLMKNLNLFINNFAESSIDPGIVLLAVVLALVVTLVSVFFPARQAAQISPLEALQEVPPEGSKGTSKSTTLIGAILLGGIILYLGASPPAQWVSAPLDYWLTLLFLGLWIIGLGLILPALIGWFGKLTRNLLKPLHSTSARLAIDNLQRGRSRVALTVTTLAVALTLVIGVTGFMAFMMDVLMFRSINELTSQQGWVVTTIDVTQGTSLYSEATLLPPEKKLALEERLGDRANTMAFNFVIVPELSFLGDTYFSLVLDPQVVKNSGSTFFTFTEGNWETAMPIMEAGCGVLLPPLTAQKNKAGLGDILIVNGKNGPVECTIAGIGTTFVLAAIISEAAAEQFVEGEPFSLYITPKPGVDIEQLDADVTALIDELSLEALTTVNYIAMMLDAFAQVRGMFNGMLLLAMITAALSVVNTTLMSVAERRKEFGLLRAVGAMRRQITAVVAVEAAFVGVIGGLLGLVAGVGIALIVVFVYGGNSWGFYDLEIWPTAWQVASPTLQMALFGLLTAPFIAAGAAWLPARNLTRGTTIETLSPSEHRQTTRHMLGGWWARGSIRTRFVLGTGVLLVIVLAAIVSFVSNHAQDRMQTYIESMVTALVTWNARALEAALPEDAETISLENMQSGQLDAESMLRFQAISEDADKYLLEEFVIVNRSGNIIMSLDPRKIGGVHTPTDAESTSNRGGLLIPVSEPIRNAAGTPVGSIHLTVEVTQIQDFLNRFRTTLWLAGGIIILLSLLLVAWLSTPLVQMTRQLATQASAVSKGEFAPVALPEQSGPFTWLSCHTRLKTRLTLAMVLAVVFMVGILELLAVPTERQQLENLLIENIISGGEWMGQILSKNLESLPDNMEDGLSLDQMMQMMGGENGFDLVQLQDLTEQARGDLIAYTALVDKGGGVIFSDRLALVGEQTSVPANTTVEEDVWWDESIWAVSIPLHQGEGGEQVGAMRLGIRRASLESFLQESRLLLRLFGVAAVLAAVLLAQVIGSAITQPVQQLAADTRRVAAGDLAVQFQVDTKDELAVLATAFNEMVAGLREREWLRDMFGRFVSQEVVEAIRAGQVQLAGENRVVSVLFCDIRGFTARSERHTPEKIVALLNEYLPVIVGAAQGQGGMVNKFGGDSTLVIYGAPKQLQESAYHAVLTALQIRKDLATLNELLIAREEEPIQIGVGINTGAVLAGAVGPEERQEYTVIGDTVNLASRIEALNKEFPQHDILISGETYEALGSRRRGFKFTDLGNVIIRGKQEGVQVWAVIASQSYR